MKVIPKQDSFEAFQFTGLESLQDLIFFLKGDDGGKASATVNIDGHNVGASIEFDDQKVVISRNEWALLLSSGIKVLTDDAFNCDYQRQYN